MINLLVHLLKCLYLICSDPSNSFLLNASGSQTQTCLSTSLNPLLIVKLRQLSTLLPSSISLLTAPSACAPFSITPAYKLRHPVPQTVVTVRVSSSPTTPAVPTISPVALPSVRQPARFTCLYGSCMAHPTCLYGSDTPSHRECWPLSMVHHSCSAAAGSSEESLWARRAFTAWACRAVEYGERQRHMGIIIKGN